MVDPPWPQAKVSADPPPSVPAAFALQIARMTFPQPEPDSAPLALFQAWFAAATAAGVAMPEAMALATATPDARPSVRMVLLKGFTDSGDLRFFTNYESRKSGELDSNPRASLLFWWGDLERQVRIEGRVYRLSAAESDQYFSTRPRLSQLGALASPQSRPIESHDALVARVDAIAATLGDGPVPRPPHWGGYAVAPDSWEFWIGHVGRLHERYTYSRTEAGWQLTLLAP